MKKLLLSLILIIACMEAEAQRIRMTDTTNRWRVHCDGGGTEYYSAMYDFRFKGDTAIAGDVYQRLSGTTTVLFIMTPTPYPIVVPQAGVYFIREDSLGEKVWARRPADTSERLIYDAAWMAGDTIRRRPLGTTNSDCWYVFGIDSTRIAGEWHRVFKIKSTATNTWAGYYFDIIEGLGATIGPGYMFTSAIDGEYNIQLECFYNKGSKPALSPPLGELFWHDDGTFSNAGSCNLAVGDIAERGGPLIFPNPANKTSSIRLHQTLIEGRLVIYTSAGQEVSNTAISNTAAIPLPDKLNVPGIYFYRLTDQKNGISYAGRFVFE